VQHWLLDEQVAPELAQQRPDWQSPEPQQPLLELQEPPVLWQQRL